MILEHEYFNEEKQKEVKTLIDEVLGDKAEVLLLCLTGSRAFGWGGSRYDIDIRGLYVAKDEYWDNCHYGKKSFDTTMEEIQHFLRDMKWRWILYEDMSMPFYIDDRFDWKGFQSFCASNHVSGQQYTTQSEINTLKRFKQVRKALHCYRQLMVPIEFLETGRILIDVSVLNEKFKSPWFPKLQNIYLHQNKENIDWNSVFEEIDMLQKRLNKRLEENTSKFDEEKFTTWRDELEDRLYG